MFAETKCMRLVWLLIFIGVAKGIAEAAKQETGTSCERPAPVEHADLESEYDSQSEFDHGAVVQYRCRIGYSIEGTSRKRKCQNGQWSDILFICYEITCSYVYRPENGKRLDERNSIGEYTYFECNPGYELTGPERLFCRADGEWLPRNPPTCKPILCPELPSLRYGRTFQDSSDGMRNDYQSVTKYTCDSGYMLEGNNGQDSRECQADGTWSGEEPKCTIPRCKHIYPFYGGDVQYFGDRKRWTFAFYRCTEGFHMSPENVKSSECTEILQWDPAPPQCFKTAKVYIPENGYSTDNKNTLLHGESYTLRCKRDYELYSEESGFIKWGSLRIRNNNGSLEPQVPKCLEKRCDAADHDKAIVKYTNGARVTSKILSQTDVMLTCEPGYDYYEGNTPMATPVKRKCVKGSIQNAPVCEEARCLVSGYLDNIVTHHYRDQSKYRLYKGQYMKPKNKLEVVCTNEEDYELFVNSTGQYLKSFTSECRYGRFDQETENFPICLERRCDATDHYKANIKYTNGTSVTSKISSQTTVRLECEPGYAYYSHDQQMETPVIRTCVKGNIVSAPACEEARCLVSGYQRNKDTNYRNYRTFDQLREGQYLEAENKLEVVCTTEDDYELFDNSTETYLKSFTSECRYGRFDKEAKEFPICLEKRCHFEPNPNACYKKNETEECIRDDFKVASRTSVAIKCQEGYKLYRSKDGSSEYIEDEEQVTCFRGLYFQGYKCISDSKVQAIKDYVKQAKLDLKKTLDRLTCRFSLFGSSSCEDPCLVPDIRFGFAKGKFGDRVSNEVTHGTKISIECHDGYYLSKRVTTTCKFGEWDIDQFPSCSPRPCQITLEPGTLLWLNSIQLKEDDVQRQKFSNGTKIEIECADGYEMKNSLQERKLNKVRKEIVCVLGEWSHNYSCKAEQCSVPKVKNAVLKSKAGDKYDHLEKVAFKCDTGHHFNENNPKDIKRQFKTKCQFGNWSRSIPARCRPDSCMLEIHEGSKYYHKGELIGSTRRFPHGTQVGLECLDNFDTFDKKGNIVETYPNLTCYQGHWKDKFTCRKRCETLNVTNVENINKVENFTTDQDVAHGNSIMVRCTEFQDNEFQLKCDNGEWKGFVDCNEKIKITNASDSSENVNGCFLSLDNKYSYEDDNDMDVSVGSFVESGTTLTVRCTNIDYYALITEYDYYGDNNSTETTVTCTGDGLSHFDLDCPDVVPDSCMELQDGIVKKRFNQYFVSCEEGFSLNLIKQKNAECSCQDGKLKSTIGNQDPKCIPNTCTLPYDIDDKLSVNGRSRVISLSSGSIVTSGDHVYFNCSKVAEPGYEPLNRRFKCEKGQWIEDEKDPNWVFGNNGTFPKCRKAICEPNCTNGGVCYKDNHCKCKPLTEGERCEIVQCDAQCTANGGECVAPGKCKCPKGRYGPTCEKKSCRLPENSAKPTDAKIVYSIGDTLRVFECEFGYILSSKDSMTCQEDGSWSNIVYCVKSVVYLISVKTGDAGLAGAGTDANVYIYLHGRHGQTNKINLYGHFETNDLDETRVEEKDIRPITSIKIGHDGSGFRPDWFIEFVSIYVESMNEYYMFRLNNAPVWIKGNEDGVLPLKDNCINTFDSGQYWYPIWKIFDRKKHLRDIGRGDGMTKRACQQRCTQLINFDCKAVHYLKNHKRCWGFSTDDERYFRTDRSDWTSVVYIQSCKYI